MKQLCIKSLLTLSAVGLLALSCSEDDVIGNQVFNGPHFVQFDGGAVALAEDSSEDLVITASISQAQSQDAVIGFDVIDENTQAGVDYEILGGNTITIPAGEFTGTVMVRSINNDNPDLPRTITLVLSTVNIGEIEVGHANPASKEKEITLSDDDCAERPACVWWGPLNVYDAPYANYDGIGEPNTGNPSGVLTLTGNVAGSGWYEERPMNIELTPDAPGSSTGTAVAAKQLFCDDCGGNVGTTRFYEGSGTFDINAKLITISYVYSRGDGSVVWTGTDEITPK